MRALATLQLHLRRTHMPSVFSSSNHLLNGLQHQPCQCTWEEPCCSGSGAKVYWTHRPDVRSLHQSSVTNLRSNRDAWARITNIDDVLSAIKAQPCDATTINAAAKQLFELTVITPHAWPKQSQQATSSTADTSLSDPSQQSNSFAARVIVVYEGRILNHFRDRHWEPAQMLVALPTLLATYAAWQPPNQAVQKAFAGALQRGCSLLFGLPSTTNYQHTRSQSAPLNPTPAGHLPAPSGRDLTSGPADTPAPSTTAPEALASLTASLSPGQAVQLVELATAAGVTNPQLLQALGQLVAWHMEVLPPDTLATILATSAASGYHDAFLFEQAGRHLSARGQHRWERLLRTIAQSGHSEGSAAGGVRVGGSGAPVLRAMQPSSLAAVLHAMASVRHADAALLQALTSEAVHRLSHKEPSVPPFNPAAPWNGGLPTAAPPGRGFTLGDLSRIAFASAVLGAENAQLISCVAREAFAQLLQLVDLQEQQEQRQQRQQQRQQQQEQQQQQQQQERRQQQPQHQEQQQQQQQEQRQQQQQERQQQHENRQQPPMVSCDDLVPLVWALSRYGACQPVMMDAVALLMEHQVPSLTPHQASLLWEACAAVVEAARSSSGHSRAGVGAEGGGGAERLLDALAPVVMQGVERYSAQEAAQLAVQCAAARHYHPDLLRALSGRVLQACLQPSVSPSSHPAPAAPPSTSIPWGPVLHLVEAVAELGFCPNRILDKVNAGVASTTQATAVAVKPPGLHQGTQPNPAARPTSLGQLGRLRSPGAGSASSQVQTGGPEFGPSPLLLPSASCLTRLAWASAALGRRDEALLLAAARAASDSESQHPLRILPMSQLIWSLAATGCYTWDTPGTRGAPSPPGGRGTGLKGSLGHAPQWAQGQGGQDDDGAAPDRVTDIMGLVLRTPGCAMAETNDVLAPHVLLLAQAYIMLMVALPDPLRRKLAQLPTDWINTLQYAWEQEVKRRRQGRRQPVNSGGQDGRGAGGWLMWGRDFGGQTGVPGDVVSAHRQLAATLETVCKVRISTDRWISINDFDLDVDITLNLGSHAVAVLMDGPEAYARGQDALPADKGDDHADFCDAPDVHAAAPDAQHHLLGVAAWRERLLQRLGWIVVRVHWAEWCRACEGGQAGRVKLVRTTLEHAGLLLPRK